MRISDASGKGTLFPYEEHFIGYAATSIEFTLVCCQFISPSTFTGTPSNEPYLNMWIAIEVRLKFFQKHTKEAVCRHHFLAVFVRFR